MGAEGASLTWTSNRSRGHHGLAAAIAVLLSVGFHWLAVVVFPSLPLGKLPSIRAPEIRYPSIHMESVRRNMTETVQRPARFRPENPEKTMEVAPSAESLVGALDTVLPEPPDMSGSKLAGEEKALDGTTPAPPRTAWEPRQDILQIEDKIYGDDIIALPRRYTPRIPRNQAAPDITLPKDLASAGELESYLQTARAGENKETNPLIRDTIQGGGVGRANTGPVLEQGAALKEESALLDEAAKDITDLKAVEQMLSPTLFVFRPTDEPGTVYFEVVIQRKQEAGLPVLPKNVLFIQDCSESMTQAKLNDCKDGLKQCVDMLGPEDGFDIMGFRENAYSCFSDWVKLSAVTRARALWFVGDMTSRGKTDVYNSLQEMLATRSSGEKPVIAVLVTDGRPTVGMVDSSDIIEQFTRANDGRRSVFCVAGGNNVNRFLIDLLAYKNRGDSFVVQDRREIPGAMQNACKEISRPVLVDLSYRFAGLDEEMIYPRSLTHLYLDRPLTIYGRSSGSTEQMVLQIVGRAGARRYDMVFNLPLNQAAAGDDGIRTKWAWHRIYHLIGEHIRTRKQAVMDEIHGIAGRYGLQVPYGGDIPLP